MNPSGIDLMDIDLERLFSPSGEMTEEGGAFGVRRLHFAPLAGAEVRLDEFRDCPEARCAFLRLGSNAAARLRLHLAGEYGLATSSLGGWLITPTQAQAPAYWLPTPPQLRRLDAQGHILQERAIALCGLSVTHQGWAVAFELPADWYLDMVVWRLESGSADVRAGWDAKLALEGQPYYLWGSKVNVHLPAGLYRFLIHGEIYTDDFVWPRRWKFRSELDAHGLFNALTGLAAATGKRIYDLLRRQVLLSVLLAQSADGGWRQGEWTDLMEAHLRLHNAAMLILEAGLEESGDTMLREALAHAADFLMRHTDRTDIGLWFLHDSLETSAENMEVMREQTNTPWLPSCTLGKSPCNKLILNTHLDAIVALERYRRLTGDERHAEALASARNAARTLLRLRPAEKLYRMIYRAIDLTLLPKERAMRLPWPLRALKRLTWMYLQPNMHRIKRVWPRLVMPGGLIERHIAPLHFDLNYHPVNVMDILRLQRCFPDEDFFDLVDNAIDAVRRLDLLQYWSESKQRQFAVVVWTEALYHLCTLKTDTRYRGHLAAAMICAANSGLGLPPALLGGDAEVIPVSRRRPCPSPQDARLRLANLSQGAWFEVLVVNPHDHDLELVWDGETPQDLNWQGSAGTLPTPPKSVPAGGWVLGRAGVWNEPGS